MRCITKTVLAYILSSALVSAREPEKHRSVNESGRRGDTFAYDVVARANEALRANVDAIDTALTAILAGVVAVIVFTADKLRDLPDPDRWIAVMFLGGATLSCVLGYVIGVSWRGFGKRDGVRPATFIPDFLRHADLATADATKQLVKAGEVNFIVRLWKQIFATAALSLLLAGVAVVTLARLHAKVV